MTYCMIGAMAMTLLGCFHLFGFDYMIDEKMKNRGWTKKYTRLVGVGHLLAFIPWLVLLRTGAVLNAEFYVQALTLLAAALPGFLFLLALELHFGKKAKAEGEER